jgi:hypothetical protein
MTVTPNEEARTRLAAAARLLTAAAEGHVFSIIEAADGARALIDRALDAEAGALSADEAEAS